MTLDSRAHYNCRPQPWRSCYIENMFTLPVGFHLAMTLWLGEEKIKVEGLVKTCDPVFGNGVEFVEVPRLERFKLRAYLDSLREA